MKVFEVIYYVNIEAKNSNSAETKFYNLFKSSKLRYGKHHIEEIDENDERIDWNTKCVG